MADYIFYILKVCLGISIFVVPYYLFLRNDTAFILKRFFLLGGVFASFLFPFLTLKKPEIIEVYGMSAIIDPDLTTTDMDIIPVEVTSGIDIHWPATIMAVYLCGALVLLLRNVFLLMRWNNVWNRAKREDTGVACSGNDEIFALFSRIFLPDSIQNTKDMKSILLHEKAHIRQLHFLDLILVEITILLTWFNPFTWLLTFLVKENHEHLADRMVLTEGIDPLEYRTQLLNQTMGVQVFSLVHYFNRLNLKKRFDMMKNSKSIRPGILKVAILLPLILVSLGMAVGKARQGNTISGKVVFADTDLPAHGTSIVIKNTTTGTIADEKGNYKLELKERSEVVFSFVGYKTQSYWFNPGEYRFIVLERETIELIPPSPPELPVVQNNTKKAPRPPDKLPVKEEVFYIVEEMPKFNGGDPALEFTKYVTENLRYPEEEAKSKKSGRVIIQFKVNPEGNVADVVVISGVSPGLDREALRVIESSPPWTPGKQRGKAVTVLFTFPVHFALTEKKDLPVPDPTDKTNSRVPELKPAWCKVDQMAEFPGGMDEFLRFIISNLRYPEYAHDNQIDGEVMVEFVINEQGKIELPDKYTIRDEKQHDPNTQRPVVAVAYGDGNNNQTEPVRNIARHFMVQEILRVLLVSPDWTTPAVKDGKPVAVVMRIPVKFVLQERVTPPSKLEASPSASTTGVKSGLSSEASEFLILLETIEDKIKLTGLKGCAWKELNFIPTIPYIDQNGVSMVPRQREKSDDPNLAAFLFRLAKIDNKIELRGIHGTNFKSLIFSWEEGECRKLINQDGMVAGR